MPITAAYSDRGALTFNILSAPTAPPVLSNSAMCVALRGGFFTYTLTAINGGTAFQATNLPEGVTLDPATGVISGRPAKAGTYQVPISALNAAGRGDALLKMVVSDALPLPAISNRIRAVGMLGVRNVIFKIEAGNDPTSYAATGLPPGLAVDPVSGIIAGTPTVAGSFLTTITASNATGPASAIVTMVIESRTAPPLLSFPLSQRLVAGQYSTVEILSDGGPIVYDISGLPPGIYFNPITGLLSGIPLTGGIYPVSISAERGGFTTSGTMNLFVADSSLAPVVANMPASLQGMVGSVLNAAVCPPFLSGGSVTREVSGLPPGLRLDFALGKVVGIPVVPGTYPATVSVRAGGKLSTAVITFVIAPEAAPLISSACGANGFVGVALTYSLTSGAGVPVVYGASSLPPGLRLNAVTGVISGVPVTAGEFFVPVTAANAKGTTSALIRFRIEEGSALPVISSPATAAALLSSSTNTFHYAITSSVGATSYSATGLPAGLSLNPSTGVIAGSPAITGLFSVPISATNSAGTSHAVLTIVVDAARPLIVAASQLITYAGRLFTYTVPVISGSPVTHLGASGLPPGLSFNAATGVITGFPSRPGTYSVTFSARNIAGTASSVQTIMVGAAPPPALPKAPVFIQARAGIEGSVGVRMYHRVFIEGLPANLTVAGLPGLELSHFTGIQDGVPVTIASMSWLPSKTGVFTAELTARNELGLATATITFTVTESAPAPLVSSSAAARGKIGSEFFYLITTNSTSCGPIYDAANLPPGLRLNPFLGTITGVPLASGLFNVSLTVTLLGERGIMVKNTATLLIGIDASDSALPVISGGAGAAGFYGIPFSHPLTADSGAKIVWPSQLPPGLVAVNGVLSGVPTAAGSFSIPVSAWNAGRRADAVLSFTVLVPQSALPIITLDPVSQTVDPGGEVVLTAAATGTPTPTFRWWTDEGPVENGTRATLALHRVSRMDTGNYWYTASNSAGTVRSRTARVIVNSLFDTWRSANFTPHEIASGQANPEASYRWDGIANLMSYAIGRNPKTGRGGRMPAVTLENDGSHLRMEFNRDTTRNDIHLIVQASDDLLTWTPIAKNLRGGAWVATEGMSTVSESGGTLRTVVVEDQVRVAQGKRRFLRLHVELP